MPLLQFRVREILCPQLSSCAMQHGLAADAADRNNMWISTAESLMTWLNGVEISVSVYGIDIAETIAEMGAIFRTLMQADRVRQHA